MRPVDTARSRIVLFGTPFYVTEDLADVPVVANNIADLAAIFTDPRLGGFPYDNCMIVPADAAVGEIGDLLVKAAEEAEDLLLFYYAGHGLLSPRRRELYLSVASTIPGSRVEFTALAFESVRNACLESRAVNRAVILDSCFSGRAIGETLASTEDEVLGQIHVSGTFTLTSAPANRAALILDGEQHTAFTERMLEFLSNGSAEAGPMLSFRDIYLYLYDRFMAEGLPIPQQRGTETADRLGLVRNRAVLATTGVESQSTSTDPASTSNNNSTSTSLSGSFIKGLEHGFAVARKYRNSPQAKAQAASGSMGWPADFIVDSQGTANAVRNMKSYIGGRKGEEPLELVPKFGFLERTYWSTRRISGWLVALAGILLSVNNIVLSLWIVFGPASDKWLWLLVPSVPLVFSAGFSHVATIPGIGFNLVSFLAYASCAVGSAMAIGHRQLGFLSPSVLVLFEFAVVMTSCIKAGRAISVP